MLEWIFLDRSFLAFYEPRNMLLNIILHWTCLIVLHVAVALTRRLEISLKPFTFTTSILPVSSIGDIPHSSLYMCIRECRSRPSCHTFSFFTKSRLCRLAGTGVYMKYDVDVYTLKAWDGIEAQDFLGPCADMTCPSQHQCIVLSNNRTICLMRECVDLFSITTPIDGSSAAPGDVTAALNRSCPSGIPGPSNHVEVRCKTSGWSQIGKITCYDCDAPLYNKHILKFCYKQMAVNQTYNEAKHQCELKYKLPSVYTLKLRHLMVPILNECSWIDAKYDVGSGKWLYESGEDFIFSPQPSDYRGISQYNATTRQVMCPDGVFEFRDESLTAGTICDVM